MSIVEMKRMIEEEEEKGTGESADGLERQLAGEAEAAEKLSGAGLAALKGGDVALQPLDGRSLQIQLLKREKRREERERESAPLDAPEKTNRYRPEMERERERERLERREKKNRCRLV